MELLLDSISSIVLLDNKYQEVVLLSLYVSLSATIISAFISITIAAYIASSNFFGRNVFIIIVNTFMSIPPVVVGLLLYIIFSASGLLGFLDLLYTPTIMIIAQFIIVTPIIISLSLKVLSDQYNLLEEYFYSLNASRKDVRNTIIFESRFNLLVIILTGLGRALSEVGAVLIVGGNIDNLTRVMTTSIVLETSRGDLSLALSLGISLLFIALILNLLIVFIKNKLL